jgi:hypothetical protein
MATTTNYGWTTPDDTSLVKDGASAIRTLGSSIDTSLNNALGTKKAGLVLLNTTSFSGVVSQSINSVFTSTYDNYYIEIDLVVPTTGGDTGFRLRSSGTDKTTNYATKGSFLNAGVIADYGSGTTTLLYVSNTTATNLHLVRIYVSRPAISGQTALMSDTVGSSDNRFVATGRQTETTTFDGFTYYNLGSNNMNGKIKVFGVNQ